MNLALVLAYLFFIGSVFGWVLELFFRKFFSGSNPEHKWINPGFCVGPYLPLYGSGLCVLYLLAAGGERWGLENSGSGRALLFVGMAVSMTLIEYIAGLISVKVFKVRLWDYSNCWGNIQGLICPLFSFFWAVLGAIYYFLLHPRILNALAWLSRNLAFSFVIGFFFGVFTIDVVYSANVLARLKRFADENGVIVRYEDLKAHIRSVRERASQRVYFFLAFQSDRPLVEHLREARQAIEERRVKRSGKKST